MYNNIRKNKLLYVSLLIFVIYYSYASHAIRRSSNETKFISFVSNIVELSYRLDGIDKVSSKFCIKSERTFFDYMYQLIPIVTVYDLDVKYGDYRKIVIFSASAVNSSEYINAINNLKHPRHFLNKVATKSTQLTDGLQSLYSLAKIGYTDEDIRKSHVVTIGYIYCSGSDICHCDDGNDVYTETVRINFDN